MQASARIHGLLARDAPVAAVLRRGPSKHVLLSSGDRWGGGGSFASDRRLDLNHRVPGETRLAEG